MTFVMSWGVRRRALALQQDGHRLPGPQIASPGKGRADEQFAVIGTEHIT
jgi:hypothetical protein